MDVGVNKEGHSTRPDASKPFGGKGLQSNLECSTVDTFMKPPSPVKTRLGTSARRVFSFLMPHLPIKYVNGKELSKYLLHSNLTDETKIPTLLQE